jgi:hypothetical protein
MVIIALSMLTRMMPCIFLSVGAHPSRWPSRSLSVSPSNSVSGNRRSAAAAGLGGSQLRQRSASVTAVNLAAMGLGAGQFRQRSPVVAVASAAANSSSGRPRRRRLAPPSSLGSGSRFPIVEPRRRRRCGSLHRWDHRRWPSHWTKRIRAATAEASNTFGCLSAQLVELGRAQETQDTPAASMELAHQRVCDALTNDGRRRPTGPPSCRLK